MKVYLVKYPSPIYPGEFWEYEFSKYMDALDWLGTLRNRHGEKEEDGIEEIEVDDSEV